MAKYARESRIKYPIAMRRDFAYILCSGYEWKTKFEMRPKLGRSPQGRDQEQIWEKWSPCESDSDPFATWYGRNIQCLTSANNAASNGIQLLEIATHSTDVKRIIPNDKNKKHKKEMTEEQINPMRTAKKDWFKNKCQK